VILDVIEQQSGSVAFTLREPHHGAEFDVPVDFGGDLADFAGGFQRRDPAAQIAKGGRLPFQRHGVLQSRCAFASTGKSAFTVISRYGTSAVKHVTAKAFFASEGLRMVPRTAVLK